MLNPSLKTDKLSNDIRVLDLYLDRSSQVIYMSSTYLLVNRDTSVGPY